MRSNVGGQYRNAPEPSFPTYPRKTWSPLLQLPRSNRQCPTRCHAHRTSRLLTGSQELLQWPMLLPGGTEHLTALHISPSQTPSLEHGLKRHQEARAHPLTSEWQFYPVPGHAPGGAHGPGTPCDVRWFHFPRWGREAGPDRGRSVSKAISKSAFCCFPFSWPSCSCTYTAIPASFCYQDLCLLLKNSE